MGRYIARPNLVGRMTPFREAAHGTSNRGASLSGAGNKCSDFVGARLREAAAQPFQARTFGQRGIVRQLVLDGPGNIAVSPPSHIEAIPPWGD